MKITIIGIGGIGGLLAGPLIRTYGDAVSLVARGERAEHLKTNGLTLHSEYFGDYMVEPATVVEDPKDLPEQDLVLICVKNGGLEALIDSMLPRDGEENSPIGAHTVVIPVMNGVSAGDLLREKLPQGIICDSVIYTVSSVEADHSVKQIGKFTDLYIGGSPGNAESDEAAERMSKVLEDAGIHSMYRKDTQIEVWKKFILNCAYNVVTAARSCTIGEIVADATLTQDYHDLMQEAYSVGLAEGVPLPDDVVEELFARLPKYAPSSDSSLSRDFDAGREGEMTIFSEEVAKRAAKHGVDVPVTERYVQLLREALARKQA